VKLTTHEAILREWVPTVSYDLPLRYKTARHASEKQRIGLAAATMVPAGATVGLNGGTTTTEVARALANRAYLRDGSVGAGPVVTVVTNALNIASDLMAFPDVKMVVTGGVARPQSYELIEPLASPLLSEIALDYVILGVDGIDPDRGASAHHEGEAHINRQMVEQAAEVVVVADSSKLGVRAFARICGVGGIGVLVTDAGASTAMVSRFEQRHIRVVIA
jgi:DeoR family transcriptional regulator, aga operon transcriptional repressor